MAKGIKIRKKSNTFKKAANGLKRLDNTSVEVGHFAEQGDHHSGYSYAELMYYHHTGSDPKGTTPVTPRPVLDRLLGIVNLSDSKFKTVFLAWWNRPQSKISDKQLLDDIGKLLTAEEKAIFGNPSLLAVTNNPTPLIDTGDLQNKVSHRDTFNKRIRS